MLNILPDTIPLPSCGVPAVHFCRPCRELEHGGVHKQQSTTQTQHMREMVVKMLPLDGRGHTLVCLALEVVAS